VGLWYLFEVQGSKVQGKEATFDGGFSISGFFDFCTFNVTVPHFIFSLHNYPLYRIIGTVAGFLEKYNLTAILINYTIPPIAE
jgi:hypothetical protein